MDLKTKQMQEKNRLAKMTGTIVSLVTLFFTAITLLLGFDIALILRIALSIVVVVVLQVLFLKFGTEHKYKYVVTVSMAVLYMVTVLNSSSTQIYALMYSIIIIVLIYGEAQTVAIGCIVALATLVIDGIIDYLHGIIVFNDMFTQIVFAAIACVMAVLFCRMQRRQTDETLKTISDDAAASAQTSDDIIKLAEELNAKFNEAQEVSSTLNESMAATHSSVMEIVEGTKNTAEAIEHQTNQTADIQESIQSVGEEATNIEKVSATVEDTVAEGVELINKLKEQAEEVAKINIETSGTTQALNDSIQDVHAITETILGISSQTNLLALNASIEAARAGEAGKGFAVVADEIRALSESTREATEEIASIIERLTKDALSASNAMSRSADVANKQNELIEETGARLNDIKKGTDELHEGVLQVKDSVSSVILANTQIMDSITNLSATSEEVAASTDTVLSVSDRAMDALDGMNDTLAVINNIAVQMETVAEG